MWSLGEITENLIPAANTIDVVTMLGQRRRRCTHFKQHRVEMVTRIQYIKRGNILHSFEVVKCVSNACMLKMKGTWQ